MNLFRTGEFRLHGGEHSSFKIDCDALTDEDIVTCAAQLAELVGEFSEVEGVPMGGLRLADAMRGYADSSAKGRTLIVDDVFTTGGSMLALRAGRLGIEGAVLFARGDCPWWITPLWRLNPRAI